MKLLFVIINNQISAELSWKKNSNYRFTLLQNKWRGTSTCLLAVYLFSYIGYSPYTKVTRTCNKLNKISGWIALTPGETVIFHNTHDGNPGSTVHINLTQTAFPVLSLKKITS